jgi:hypothetical protein
MTFTGVSLSCATLASFAQPTPTASVDKESQNLELLNLQISRPAIS